MVATALNLLYLILHLLSVTPMIATALHLSHRLLHLLISFAVYISKIRVL